MNFSHYLWVGLGGMLGSTLRYWISSIIPFSAGRFAWATFGVNMLGCLLIGYLYQKIQSEPLRYFLITGLLGGFTTFSGFGLELYQYAAAGAHGKALIYGLLSLSLGYMLVVFGKKIALLM